MTDFATMVGGGESGDAAIVPGDPDASYLVELITPDDSGEAMMPEGESPLSANEIELIRLWIEQGATNDTRDSSPQITADHPPTYLHASAISALDYSPDGKWLACSGYHEVFLIDAAARQVQRRLIGLSSRIEAVRFSPDGTRLAVAGGDPGLFGEIQVWKVSTGELLLSKTISHDTLFGISWSPDGTRLAFGSTDTNLRAIDATTGQQILFQGAHEDWIRDTVWSVDGSRLVSVGRDMTCKLTEVTTERFIDNITSITPGVLKGGIASVARHPQRDEVLIGGSDGVPKIYRMDRLTKRRIGDDANLIRRFPAMKGRIQSVAISADGSALAAATSLDGRGQVSVYAYDFDTGLPDDLKAILSKVVSQRTAEEKKRREEYVTDGIRQIATIDAPSGIYSIAFDPSGRWLATGGGDGLIRLFDTETGSWTAEFSPIQILADRQQEISDPIGFDLTSADSDSPDAPTSSANAPQSEDATTAVDTATRTYTRIRTYPPAISFRDPTDYAQLIVVAQTPEGTWEDVTHQARFTAEADQGDMAASLEWNQDGLIQLRRSATDVSGRMIVRLDDLSATVPVSFQRDADWKPDFIRDVNPVLSRLGCNSGTCHGSAGGKKGFKLSLRGYDPLFDVRSLTDDLSGRRVNLAAPQDSLMLLKPSAMVPHEGGQRFKPGDKYYEIVRRWIASGAGLKTDGPRVKSIEVSPINPVLSGAGALQRLRVEAVFSDGHRRDVTREAFITVSDTEIAKVEGHSLIALRRGETPIVVRYEGAFAATTATVMGSRDGFAWVDPPVYGPIDQMVAAKWKRMKILPSDLCTDEEFLRRVYLDLTGLPPSVEAVRRFLEDSRPSREKREAVVDALIGNPDFVEYWTNKWADLLQVNRKFLGAEGAAAFRNWIRTQVDQNTPYDQFVRSILTAEGSNRENPAASYFKILRSPDLTMENTTHLFLGIRFNCNKCHDHPFERWTQDQYYQTAAWFAQVELKPDPESGDRRIGGSAVESAKPLFEIVQDVDQGEMIHERTGQPASPAFPYPAIEPKSPNQSRRQQFADWLTAPENPYFARSYVNRLWGYLTGVGLIEPLDDIRAGNPPTNPELLEYLTHEFIHSGFDSRHIMRLICTSRTYQLSIQTNPFNVDDHRNYSHAIARRLPAEVLYDAIHFVTGAKSHIPGVPEGTRAAALADAGIKLPSGFLSTLGRPARESACECERSSDLQLGSVLALVSGPDVANAIGDPHNAIAELVSSEPDNARLIDKLYYRILGRGASDMEIAIAQTAFDEIAQDHESLVQELEKRKAWVAEMQPKWEQQRADAMADAKASMEATIARLDPKLAEREAEHQRKLEAARQALAEYRENMQNLEQWKHHQLAGVDWIPLRPLEFQTASGAEFEVGEDRSILVSPADAKDIYTFVTQVNLTGISAIRLEMLPDERLPSQGPGTAENGNLVLTEFTVEVASPTEPENWVPVKIAAARANFEQNGFPIANAINGTTEDNGGWALNQRNGKVSWGCFQLQIPVGFAAGTRLRFRMHQHFDNRHQIGKFRISVTRSSAPVGLSVPESIAGLLHLPADRLSEDQQKQLRKLFEQDDRKFQQLKQAVVEAEKPLEIHPDIVEARQRHERASKPVPPDPELVRLESDVKKSEQQLANLRLTAAQDLTWALINSPSFLFNH